MPRFTVLVPALALLLGCQGNISVVATEEGSRLNPSSPDTPGGMLPPEVEKIIEDLPPSTLPPPEEVNAFLPRRIRRLTNGEIERSLSELVGQDLEIAPRFPEDARQRYFRPNAGQIVDPLLASALSDVARELADAAAAEDFQGIVTCTEQDRACAEQSLGEFAERAWRRPVQQEELDALVKLWELGNTNDGFATGITWGIEAIMQAPGLVYTTELGDSQTEAGTVVLSPWEAATQLAYITTGAPPDDALRAVAEDGSILEAEVRAQQARRLFDTPAGKLQLRELVMQWLGLDKLSQTSKDANTYPEFMDLQGAIIQEARDFIDHVVDNGLGVEELLGADYTIVHDQQLAQLYGVGGDGRLDLSNTPRRGILSQTGFLSAHSNPGNSGPIHRGVTVIERVLCVKLAAPGELDIQVTPPEPDPEATTRELFAQHAADPACQGCHVGIDGVGFAFEQFDPIGRLRDRENNKPVDTTGELIYTEVAGQFDSSKEMIEAIAVSDTAKRCFAQNAFGFASAQNNDDVAKSFEAIWEQNMPTTDRLDDALVLFISSDLFLHRDPR